MSRNRRRVLLGQLPIPPAGHTPVRGNVPLAAGYLKMFAEARGLGADFDIELLPARQANGLGDLGLVEAILARDPSLVGFTCYLWNIERTLWLAERLKAARPELKVILGGPEISADNAWVLESPAVDFAAIGEGEQTFAELLAAWRDGEAAPDIDGLHVRPPAGAARRAPRFRQPLARLDEISSPYLAGILDAEDERMLLLETVRGCVFKCKFCYYPKSYDALYFLSAEKIVANVRHARERGARELVLLDPTLNQRRDFEDFLKLLIRENHDRQLACFGELRAEGITPPIARLLREANFTEVEIGLQSVDPRAQELMDRKNNLRAFERGVRAMMDEGIAVKIDLIVGLPGDTADSVRRGIDYLCDNRLCTSAQVFNLAVLPGTAFRQEAATLGLRFQPRPPYYVLETPTLKLPDFYRLMEEAQAAFGAEYDALPAPRLDFDPSSDGCAEGPVAAAVLDLDLPSAASPPPASLRAQAFTLWLRSRDFSRCVEAAAGAIDRVLADNPFTTLQTVLETRGDPRAVTPGVLERLARTGFARPTYLDRFYAVQPGRARGAKRLVTAAPLAERARVGEAWIDDVGEFADIVWRAGQAVCANWPDGLAPWEYVETDGQVHESRPEGAPSQTPSSVG